MDFMRRLFPCRFNEPKCRGNPFGCRCGKSKKGSSTTSSSTTTTNTPSPYAVQNQQDLANAVKPSQQEQDYMSSIMAGNQAQLPGLQGRAGTSGEDLFRQTGGVSNKLADLISGRLGQSGGDLFNSISPEAQAYSANLSNQMANPTQISYQDMFNPLFQRAQQQVGAFANSRGLVGSGIELEKMGRAGVDLTLGQAQARQQNALMNEQLRQSAVDRVGGLINSQMGLQQGSRSEAGGLSDTARGMSERARAELSQYLGQGMDMTNSIKNRQASGLGVNVNASQGYGTTQTNSSQTTPTRTNNPIWGTLGTIGGAALGTLIAPGFGTALGAQLGGGLGKSLGGGDQSPPTNYGAQGYHGAGYANYPQEYQQQYGGQQNNASGLASILNKFRGG